MTNSSVQIIYLNGPSSSGKTTLAKALQHSFETLFLLVDIDEIIGRMSEKVNDWTGGKASLGYSWKKSTDESGNHIQELQIGPYAEKIAKTFQEIVLMLAKLGHHLIIDDVSFGKKQVDEWKELLTPFNVLWIGVNGPAQQLYFQLGYIPEGHGITYRGQLTTLGQPYPLDDDLILWLIKTLPSKTGPR